jgi:hypothetical protein
MEDGASAPVATVPVMAVTSRRAGSVRGVLIALSYADFAIGEVS